MKALTFSLVFATTAVGFLLATVTAESVGPLPRQQAAHLVGVEHVVAQVDAACSDVQLWGSEAVNQGWFEFVIVEQARAIAPSGSVLLLCF